MVPLSVQKSIEVLKGNPEGVLTRETLVAYNCLAAFSHHFPSLKTLEIETLLREFSWVKDREPSRSVKQRRIALAEICKQMA